MDARVFPEEILGEQARDRVKLVDSKENVQNESTAAVYRQIYKNGRQDTTTIQYKERRSRKGEAEQEVSLLAFEVGGLRIT